jgi:hypothetical protein
MKSINKDLINNFNWGQCIFCKNVYPIEKGLRNLKNRPRINDKTKLCTDCEKIKNLKPVGVS